ncbi:hypothetical protein F5B18DRAFT_648037 [Nemania serpens]|nr:hypothetical protein F5B18DRAFT_648037 [Nemania serpens]
MLSRSGLSIRKLIPHRRLSDEDMSIAEPKKEDNNPLLSWTNQDGANGGDGRVYMANRPSGISKRRKRAPGPIIATSPLTHSDILRPLPPLPSETPRSSASSSCRCERHAECDCPLLSWKRRSPRYSIASSKGDSEEPSLLSCVSASGPDDTLTQHIPRSRFCLSNDPQDKGDLALALSFEERREETRTKERPSEENPFQELSENIQQFMQETEDAFKSIGNTFSAAHEPTPPTPPPKEEPHTKNPSVRAHSTFGSPRSSPLEDTTPLQKPKMRRSRKSKQMKAMRPTRKSAAPTKAARSGPRWTLSENVSGLLRGRLFRGVEADEMLTPEQIEAFKQQRITKLQVDKMAEALERELAHNEIEHFDIEDLPSRSGSADSKTDIDMEALADEKRAVSFNTSSTSPRQQVPFSRTQTFPTVSSRHTRSSSRRLMTELPSIPETKSTSEFVYLRSSVYSLTTPRIQHGPIRLSKSDLVKLGGDDGLDWTAFQMAILGGAGDLFSDSEDEIRQMEEEEIADITGWFDSWHFESTGKLVTSNYEASSPTSTLSGDEIPDLSYSEIESDSPHSPQRRPQDSRRKSRVPAGLQLGFDLAKGRKQSSSHYFADGRGAADGALAQDSEQKDVAANRQSAPSLPPSPMLDLRVIRSDNGDDMDVVPMGYNLGHDLGDFLKWEAEHAYAGDFNSPPLI